MASLFGENRLYGRNPGILARRGEAASGRFEGGDTLAAVAVAVKSRARLRAGSRLASVAAAGAAGVSTWLVIDRRPIPAGLIALASGALMLLASATARVRDMVLERTVDSFVDRGFDGAILGAIAWAYRGMDPWVAAGALVALGSSFLASYVRARGASLGYGVDESQVTRGLRYGLVSVGLLTDGLGWTMWAVAGLMALAALVRASQVAKEERA
jgi:hypothetical protein